jgi:hypothetical protein
MRLHDRPPSGGSMQNTTARIVVHSGLPERRLLVTGAGGDVDSHQRVLERMERAWSDFQASYAGLGEPELLEPGVTGAWSVRDIIAHVTWWEEEALHHLPAIGAGRRPPRYSVTYGGIDAFNALMTERRRDLPLAEVLRQQADVHGRLLEYVAAAPAELLLRETRFRRRLRLDTWGHYPKHAAAIRAWRDRR